MYETSTAPIKYVQDNKDALLKDWIDLIQIPGPSGQEQKRGQWISDYFKKVGMEDVHMDEVGNVIGYLNVPGATETVLIGAHMDTVFDMNTDLTPKIEEDGWMYAPGCSDDTPAVISLIWLKKALDAAGVKPNVNIIFIATVMEETGLRGMKHFMKNLKGNHPDMMIAIDGDFGRITAGGMGVYWIKVTAKTNAGHTLKSMGKPSGVKSIAKAVEAAYKYQIPQEPEIALNLGVIGGGTVANAICEEAFVTVDARCQDAQTLETLVANVRRDMKAAIEESGCEHSDEIFSEIDAGQIPGIAEHKLVKTAVAVHKSMDMTGDVTYSGSTDGNVAIAAGIPTISIGIVKAEFLHSLKERALVPTIMNGMEQLIKLVLSL